MKKIINIMIVFFLALSITACSKEKEDQPITIKLNKENQLADIMSYQIESITKTKDISPDVISDTYTFYKPHSDDNVLLDLVMNVTNLKDSELDLSKKTKVSFEIGDEEYVAPVAVVSDDGKTLNDDGKIVAKGTSKVHYYVEVAPKKLTKEINLKIATTTKEKEEANLKFKLSELDLNYTTANLNEVITFENYSEITLQSTSITKEITPVNPSGLYTYYKVSDQANSYLDISATIKNISGSDMLASNVAVLKLFDNDGNEFPVNVFCENESRSEVSDGITTTLVNGQSMLIHFAFEVPDTLINNQKQLRISYQGKVYIVSLS